DASLQVLKMGLFPDEIAGTDEMTILAEIRKRVKRGVGLKKDPPAKRSCTPFYWHEGRQKPGQVKN
ncbi:hypothetical protein, partial [Virgibacillus proomii]|uniref:hypothetical protein n=1 Tax=Virgibacillus proomii TaxID=84407 RepID=UPI0035A16277|nr:hypothetical protein [Virgibacillus proomii]